MRFTQGSMLLKKIALAGLLVGMLPLLWAHAAPEIDGKRFGDWGGTCEKTGCFLQQVLNQKDKPLMATAIGYPPGKNFPAVLFHLPPTTQMKDGVQLRVDKNPTIKFNGKCDKQACFAGFALDEEMMGQLVKGKQALVMFTPAPKQKPVVLPISLKGLGAGLNAVLK